MESSGKRGGNDDVCLLDTFEFVNYLYFDMRILLSVFGRIIAYVSLITLISLIF